MNLQRIPRQQLRHVVPTTTPDCSLAISALGHFACIFVILRNARLTVRPVRAFLIPLLPSLHQQNVRVSFRRSAHLALAGCAASYRRRVAWLRNATTAAAAPADVAWPA